VLNIWTNADDSLLILTDANTTHFETGRSVWGIVVDDISIWMVIMLTIDDPLEIESIGLILKIRTDPISSVDVKTHKPAKVSTDKG
jgi:hypothetical protein